MRCELPAFLASALLAGSAFVGSRFYLFEDAAFDRKLYLLL